jgi:hypothetical protein
MWAPNAQTACLNYMVKWRMLTHNVLQHSAAAAAAPAATAFSCELRMTPPPTVGVVLIKAPNIPRPFIVLHNVLVVQARRSKQAPYGSTLAQQHLKRAGRCAS